MENDVETAQDINRSERSPILAIMGASSGNLVEWYDFYVYSFTSLYFAAAFFPAGDRTSQLLNTAGIFAARFPRPPARGLAVRADCRQIRPPHRR